LIALLALTVGLLRRLWRVRVGGAALFDPGVLAPLLAMQVIWYVTWVPGLEQGIVTGIAIAVAATNARWAEGRPTHADDSRPGGTTRRPAAQAGPDLPK
jgi:hypothetical protein